MPEGMPDRMPARMPEDMPDRMPEDMPDKMPEGMSDRMPEDLPVTKCINVMVGITRSKVFFPVSQWVPQFNYHHLSNHLISIIYLHLTNKTREIRRVIRETQGFQTKPRVWQLWPIYFWGTIQLMSFVSRVITGKSRFRHGWRDKHGGNPKTPGFRVQTQGFL